MSDFSLGGAWTKGFGFFAGQAVNFAIVLIGIGIAVPFVIQYLLMGGPPGTMNPALLAEGGLGAIAAAGGAVFAAAMLVAYVLQMGSYFGAWRLGFAPDESLAGAILYGLVAGLLLILLFVVLAVVVGLTMVQISAVAGAILVVLAVLPLLAMFYTAVAATLAVGAALVMLFVVAIGGAASSGLDAAGGGGVALLIVLVVAALLLWLSARFSCTTSILAQRKSYNLIEAVAESWRVTAAAQWRVTLYLGLLGFVFLLAYFILFALAGAGVATGLRGGGAAQLGLGFGLVSLILSIPVAYVVVLVPAGIYRELVPVEDAAAAVFA